MPPQDSLPNNMSAAQEWDMLQDLDGLTEEELLAQIEQLDPEAAAAARAAGAAGSGAPSSIEGTALVLEAAPPSSPAAPSSADPSKLNEVLKEMERLTTENEAMKAALASGKGLADLDSRSRPTRSTLDTASVLKASAVRSKALAGSASGTAELERQLAQKKAALEFKQRGVDICIMMDCTGSMSHCIQQVKSKAREICDLAPTLHPDAITRLAFVGYRDYGYEAGDALHVVVDFVDKSRFSILQSTLSSIRPSGGGNAEDVTGALKKVLELSWSSTTRLIIHFGDSPCHGRRYHDGHPVNGPDTYPAGDPNGLVPEELLKQLVANRVDYHFARIGRHTDIMTRIFKQVYDDSPGAATFEIQDYTNQAGSFMPVIVKSLTSSMHRSFRGSSGRSSTSSSKSSTLAPGAALPVLYNKLI